MQASDLPKSTGVDTPQTLTGELEERERDELFMFNPNEELVVDPPDGTLQEVLCDETGQAASTDTKSELGFNDDPDVRNLRSALQLCSPGTLQKRERASMLKARMRDQNEQIERGRQHYVLRQASLIERGVSEEHAALLPTNSADPLPSPIQRDLQATGEQALRNETSAKKQRTREASKEPNLIFITPVPRTQSSSTAPARYCLAPQKKRKSTFQKGNACKNLSKPITSYFHSQK